MVEDGKAVIKRVKISSESGTDQVVEQGLAGDEHVIVEGMQSVRPGVAVIAKPLPPTVRK